jgi:AraC-like DNA-binding protein
VCNLQDPAWEWHNGARTPGLETMTARANSLTSRVAPKWETLPAGDLRVFLNGLDRLGYDTWSVLRAAGVRDEDMLGRDATVPCEAFGAVLAEAQKQRFTPNLGLELARVTPLGSWPLLDYLVLTADTVGAGARQLVRYFRLTGGPIVIDIDDTQDPIRIDITGVAPFATEYEVALMILHFRSETENRVAATGAYFRHALDDPEAFERALGCPVAQKASWNGISLTREAWQLPLRRRDPILRQMLEAHADEILARLPERTGLAVDVQRALASRVAGGDVRIGSVARVFAMSARTLQRRLEEEGISYQKLLDTARREAAGRYIAESPLAIGEIAYLLGYSEPAAFHRAFKRWYATTPDLYRSLK